MGRNQTDYQRMKFRTSPVFQLLLAERRYSNAWYLIFLLLLTLPPALALAVTPVADVPGVVAATRAQITYLELLVILFCYYGLCVLQISHRQRQRGQRLLWRSMGMSDGQIFAHIFLLFAMEIGVVSFLALLLCAAWGNYTPNWNATCLQAWLCIWLAALIPLSMAIGIAQRLSLGLATLLIIFFNICGLYAVPLLDMFRNNNQTSALWQIVSEKLWAVMPQISLADQSERITFSWQPIPWLGFDYLMAYLFVWCGVTFYVGYKLFRRDPVTATMKASA